MTRSIRRAGWLLASALLAANAATAQTPVRASASRLLLDQPQQGADSKSLPASSTVQVVVRLTDPPLAVAVGANAKRAGSSMSMSQRQAYMAMLRQKQDAVAAQVVALGGVETSRLSKVQNSVIFSVRVATLPQIARIGGVTSVRPVGTYNLSLANTVPYIGAKALQDIGITGAGVKVAVLDSGIDYTHKNLGGSGRIADYQTAIASPTIIPSGLFPTAKVIGGYDFVGSQWPNGPRTSDPNPIDEPPAGGHGTHVADIIAGASLDGTHKGVAPGAQLLAVKVCSNQSTSCNGEALLLGMDYIIDPNGDLDFSDAPDIVNLSLGSSYGQREDDLTEAISNAVRFGIVAVISAGNAADRPYIVGSPSTAPEAISVAQTQTPTASTYALRVNAPPGIAGSYANTATLDFAPIGAGFTGDVKTALQAGGANNLACLGLPAGSLTGKVALVDRGSCSVSIKVDTAARAGAIGVLVALIAPGDPISFSFGGGSQFVPSLVIQQSLGASIKANIGAPVAVTVNDSTRVGLAGSIVGSSSRGPSSNLSALKPEIGAPGASVSALLGTGNGESTFGGTSGAAPMVAGSAALLFQKFPTATPIEIKARLLNGANSTIYANPATEPGVLAPITRIGAGEVRVDKSANISTGLWDATNPYSVALSFGTLRATGVTSLSKKIAVRNYGSTPRFYTITPSFRYAADAASGAVTISAPPTITVPANGTAAFVMTLRIDAAKLPDWNLGFAGDQGNGAKLQGVEFDGYVAVNDPVGSVSIPWHVLPHKAAAVEVDSTSLALTGGTGSLGVRNLTGATAGGVEVFSLTGTSPQITNVLPPLGSQEVLIDLKAVGVRSVDVGAPALQFAVSTYGQRAHPAHPAEFDVYIDANGDGIDDFVIFNSEQTGFGATGATLVTVVNLATNARVARFYIDSDLNSSNAVLTVLASDVGINSPLQPFKFSVYAFDNVFTGEIKDAIVGMSYTYGRPKYSVGAFDSFTVPIGASGPIPVTAVAGGATASPSQTGLLLLYNDGKTGRESDVVNVTP